MELGDRRSQVVNELERLGDAIRALKRYLAREVFTLITQRRKEINATQIAA